MLGSTKAKVREEMAASCMFNLVNVKLPQVPRKFTDSAWDQTAQDILDSYDIKFIPVNYSNLPEDWEDDPIFQKEDLLDVMEHFYYEKLGVSRDELQIKEGTSPIIDAKGKLVLFHTEPMPGNKYARFVDPRARALWNYFRAHDRWFTFKGSDGKYRTASVAFGLFYSFVMEGGNYPLIDDAIKLWFILSPCLINGDTLYDNNKFLARAEWALNHPDAKELGVSGQFTGLLDDPKNQLIAKAIAHTLNKKFENNKIAMGDIEVDKEKFLEEYNERKAVRQEAGISEKVATVVMKTVKLAEKPKTFLFKHPAEYLSMKAHELKDERGKISAVMNKIEIKMRALGREIAQGPLETIEDNEKEINKLDDVFHYLKQNLYDISVEIARKTKGYATSEGLEQWSAGETKTAKLKCKEQITIKTAAGTISLNLLYIVPDLRKAKINIESSFPVMRNRVYSRLAGKSAQQQKEALSDMRKKTEKSKGLLALTIFENEKLRFFTGQDFNKDIIEVRLDDIGVVRDPVNKKILNASFINLSVTSLDGEKLDVLRPIPFVYTPVKKLTCSYLNDININIGRGLLIKSGTGQQVAFIPDTVSDSRKKRVKISTQGNLLVLSKQEYIRLKNKKGKNRERALAKKDRARLSSAAKPRVFPYCGKGNSIVIVTGQDLEHNFIEIVLKNLKTREDDKEKQAGPVTSVSVDIIYPTGKPVEVSYIDNPFTASAGAFSGGMSAEAVKKFAQNHSPKQILERIRLECKHGNGCLTFIQITEGLKYSEKDRQKLTRINELLVTELVYPQTRDLYPGLTPQLVNEKVAAVLQESSSAAGAEDAAKKVIKTHFKLPVNTGRVMVIGDFAHIIHYSEGSRWHDWPFLTTVNIRTGEVVPDLENLEGQCGATPTHIGIVNPSSKIEIRRLKDNKVIELKDKNNKLLPDFEISSASAVLAAGKDFIIFTTDRAEYGEYHVVHIFDVKKEKVVYQIKGIPRSPDLSILGDDLIIYWHTTEIDTFNGDEYGHSHRKVLNLKTGEVRDRLGHIDYKGGIIDIQDIESAIYCVTPNGLVGTLGGVYNGKDKSVSPKHFETSCFDPFLDGDEPVFLLTDSYVVTRSRGFERDASGEFIEDIKDGDIVVRDPNTGQIKHVIKDTQDIEFHTGIEVSFPYLAIGLNSAACRARI
ncbi:MAG: hypothetical protein JW788_05235, partial [Candidatus Omnitrophica bacterium]|nr:hypothetical protein [Candidatus Omnitrophota bacterium]